MMEDKVPCVECGALVSASFARRMKGLCVACKTKQRTANPFARSFASLVQRVHDSPEGLAGLSDVEKIFYAVSLFRNEVNNGGFHQFFFNSSGSYYELIENALLTLDEPQVLELLHQARQIVFPEIAVPIDTEERRGTMPEPTPDLMAKLNELGQRFYRLPDTLTPKLEAFARQRGLVPADAEGKKAQS